MKRLLVAQLNMTIGDFLGNGKKIFHALEEARRQKAEMVLFAELTLCGYPPEDLLMHGSFLKQMQELLDQVVLASSGLFIVIGLVRTRPDVKGKPLYNSAAVISDGKLLGFHDKMLLPTYDVFDERRYFEPGRSLTTWMHQDKKIGILICEDIWAKHGNYAIDPVIELASHHVDLLLNLSASPYQFQKPAERLSVCARAAKLLSAPVVICCQVGGNDQLVFDGYSSYLNKRGELVQQAAGFKEELMLVDLRREEAPHLVPEDPVSDLYQALVLGTRDYFHKQGFKKGCLGLSGGIDSALVAAIATDALGAENVLGVAMPSRYSSKSSLDDARALATNLRITYKEISIETLFSDYLTLLQPHFEGRIEDITEENLQSRIRGMLLMALSNKFGYIVLSTGNKSELALGYCTLYGDMAGGLAVIADVAKMQVYTLARFVNRHREIIPLSSIEKAPSAELRPNQKDSDTLPDYAIIEHVLQGYVEECLTAEEISLKNGIELPLVQKLIHQIHIVEYKRRQAPPGIRVSKKAFRVGRNYPIVQKWH